MRRTIFEAGFSSPTHAYGIVPPAMGSIWSQIKDVFKAPASVVKPVTPSTAPPAAPQPSGTVFGIPTSYVLIGGAVALTLGVVAALVGSKKKAAGPPPVPPKVAGRRRR